MSKSRIQDHREFDPDSRCPSCGAETETGFGLAGGGYGPYTYCHACSMVTSKSPEPDDRHLQPREDVDNGD
jgi:hypothetical protein